MSLMYEHTHTWNPLVGCRHECIYCYARRVAKRQKHRCADCYNFAPHEHPERLGKRFPKGSQVFVCSMGDIAFASEEYRQKIYATMGKQQEVTFLLQSKDPRCFITGIRGDPPSIPKNAVIGVTIESNRYKTVAEYDTNAPYTWHRKEILIALVCRKYMTIEPIMEFDMDIMVEWIKNIDPEFVYIGYDNHKHRLPEPSIGKTLKLMERLEEFTEVRRKTIRKAWWEE